jgi:murein DD-endopeptidase MepM/ murein hydrolase activator NlpD
VLETLVRQLAGGSWKHVLVALCGWLLALQPAGAGAVPAAVHHAFPVDGRVRYTPYHHDYPAVDILGGCGRTVRSPVDGRVLELSRVDRWKSATDRGADRGGLSFSIRGDDGVRYYGSHLSRIDHALAAGDRVRAGEPIGRVGRSGDAAGLPCHLHFGISPVCHGTGQWWIRRGVVNPYAFLRSWQRGANRSPVRAVAAWKVRHGCPTHPLSDP